MKSKLLFLSIFSLLTFHYGFSNGEPCDGETVIFENTQTGSGNLSDSPELYGQSFFITTSTTVGGINLFVPNVTAAPPPTLNLHNGPTPTDAILISAVCELGDNNMAHFIFDTPVELTPGEYVFTISPTALDQIEISTMDSNAPGGDATYWNGDGPGFETMSSDPFTGINNGQWSIRYQLVSCAIAPIPTLSQWGVIVCLIMLLIIGVVSLKYIVTEKVQRT